mmetsp:Transcript_3750/g.6582  ORF Transcript_3750/g.6582 Transcript_3750/m.6582 type:complete len:758 (+) Transcript_3750:129-2402(+)|eukprot:CAMPEP_0184514928 /NCGR_PEP_ID=MMETSP0198_2-20121128/4226_1 /TAXON_ID=1112570 /ORGANISM="Thraustochytrium sp., Strain LLF1b" /LENGTH=757 /DNA_ID=CAMNT_0026905153 /DNA_START=228 /DNA_END=2501 /DNA_ORIENTATION=+
MSNKVGAAEAMLETKTQQSENAAEESLEQDDAPDARPAERAASLAKSEASQLSAAKDDLDMQEDDEILEAKHTDLDEDHKHGHSENGIFKRLLKLSFKEWVVGFLVYALVPLYVLTVVIGASVQQTTTDSELFGNETGCLDLTDSSTLSDGYAFAMSIIPFMLVIDGILGLQWSSHVVAPWSLLITVLLGLSFFDGRGWLATEDFVTTCGIVFLTLLERVLWTLFDYAFAVFAAFLFLEVVERWGVVRSMQDEFEVLADSPARKILLVTFCFAIIIAVVAPGGSNFLIAGSILIRMNINNEQTEEGRLESGRRIAAICLFGNGLTSAFNLVGVCIIAISEDIVGLVAATNTSRPCEPLDVKCAAKQVGFQFSMQFLIFCVLSPVIMVFLFTKSFNSDMKKNLPLLLMSGAVYGVVQLGTALFIGPELPCLTAAGASLAFYMAYLFMPNAIRRCLGKAPKDEEEDATSEHEEGGVRALYRRHSYVMPFVLLMSLLFLVRAVPNLQFYLEGGDHPVMSKVLNIPILNIQAACETWSQTFPWVSSSGMIVVWSSVLTPFIVPFRSTELEREKSFKKHINKLDHYSFWRRYRKIIKSSFVEALNSSKPILVAIASYAALAKVMAGFNMTQTIANGFVGALSDAPAVYTLVAPFIGFLGAGLTGSTTTSNFLFGSLQVQTAIDLGLVTPDKGSVWAVAGVQILGSSAGELISPMNAVFSAVLLKSAVPESDIIYQVIKVFIGWMAMCMLVSFVALNLLQDVY